MEPSFPTGTLTFLFTDIEGSTKLWEHAPQAMQAALARHDDLMREVIEAQGGHVFKTVGDAFCASYARADQALAAAHAAQQALLSEAWPAEVGLVRVRMALHSGMAEERDGDYFGPALNRVARLLAAGHGEQVLLSQATAELVKDHLPPGVDLRDLGERRLKDLARPERVYQLCAPGLRADFPPLKTLEANPNNLPAPLTRFIGREKEMAEIQRLLGGTRLLTLVGPGGTGKTRLSLQVAAEVLPEFPHGAWFVELAPLTDPGLVPQAVAGALGVREAQGRAMLKALTDYLQAKSLLIILDNCEHLVEACAQLADGLLRAAPGVRLLATTREGLGIAGETTYPVPALTLPSAPDTPRPPLDELIQVEAVRLFIDRAQAVQPSFAVTQDNAPAVAEICNRLDGMPLAIELAAARVRALTAEQIAARLDDRFRLLTGGNRAARMRHQTLQALVDWSYEWLPEAEQVLLRRLSVFAGGWTLAASETICAGNGIQAEDVLDLMARLVDKSLVVVDERNGQSRYRMLDTIQQYAREKASAAGAAVPVRAQHLDFFVKLAEEGEAKLRTPEQLTWLNCLEIEHNNLRGALRWTQESGDIQAGLRLAGALFWFWLLRGYADEGRRWLEGTLKLADAADHSPARAKALRAAGFLAIGQGDIGAGSARLEESLVIFRTLADAKGIGDSLLGLGRGAYFQGDYAAARSLFQESLLVSQAADYQWGSAQALYRLGMVNLIQGDYAQARSHFEESVPKFRASGDKWGLSYSLSALGEEALRRGDYALANSVLEESLTLFQELESKSGMAVALSELGWLALSQGEYVAARARLEESLALRRDMGHRVGMAIAFNLLGDVALHVGDTEQAKALIDEGLALRQEAGSKSGIAWSLQNLGYVAQRQGESRPAAALFEKSLALFVELGNKIGVAECLEGLASVAAADWQAQVEGRKADRAPLLFGAAETLRELASTPLPPYRRADYDHDLAAAHKALDERAFSAAWAAGRAMTWEQAAAYALED